MTDSNPWKDHWSLPDDVTYLNHGSFGPSPRVVQEARARWSARLEAQPMDFYLRQWEDALESAAGSLAEFVGTQAKNLVFVDNASYGMNIVAASVELQPGDEVLATDHEYGAVTRLWQQVCARVGAKLVVQPLPFPLTSQDEVVDVLFRGVTKSTKLILASHVTSPTAVILPVKEVCRRARELKISTCIDGPHAVAMLPLGLDALDCDYYTASCHKWLCAPFGTGFLYVHPRRQSHVKPVVVSWGGNLAGRPPTWKDEFQWIGTRDPAAFLAVPDAIDFLQSAGVDAFRQTSHQLASVARARINELTGMPEIHPDSPDLYGTMAAVELPRPSDFVPRGFQHDPLQDLLWGKHRIEIPITHWKGRRVLRVSCHLYNTSGDLDCLLDALGTRLSEES